MKIIAVMFTLSREFRYEITTESGLCGSRRHVKWSRIVECFIWKIILSSINWHKTAVIEDIWHFIKELSATWSCHDVGYYIDMPGYHKAANMRYCINCLVALRGDGLLPPPGGWWSPWRLCAPADGLWRTWYRVCKPTAIAEGKGLAYEPATKQARRAWFLQHPIYAEVIQRVISLVLTNTTATAYHRLTPSKRRVGRTLRITARSTEDPRPLRTRNVSPDSAYRDADCGRWSVSRTDSKQLIEEQPSTIFTTITHEAALPGCDGFCIAYQVRTGSHNFRFIACRSCAPFDSANHVQEYIIFWTNTSSHSWSFDEGYAPRRWTGAGYFLMRNWRRNIRMTGVSPVARLEDGTLWTGNSVV